MVEHLHGKEKVISSSLIVGFVFIKIFDKKHKLKNKKRIVVVKERY